MVTAQSINELLEAVEPSLKEFRQRQEKRDLSDAPRFSAFTYIQPDEVRLSRIIKDLLDPKGAHGQGSVFLEAFLNLIGLNYQIDFVRRAACEERTSGSGSSRRHDIFLDASQWILSIENKPWAGDQDSQIRDYLDDLSQRGKQDWHLVYLTKDGRSPSEKSIPPAERCEQQQKGRLILLSFERLREWLQSCSEKCKAPRVKEFLKDFRQYIHEQLLGFAPLEEQTMIVDAVLKNNHLEAALELLRSADNLYGQLLKDGMSTIRASLEEWKVESTMSVNNYSLALKPPCSQGWHIRFEDDSGHSWKWEKWIYGIRYDDDVRNDANKRVALDPLKQQLAERLGQSGSDYGYWLWYRYFDGQKDDAIADYDNKRKTRLWVDMHNGKFAQHIIALARLLNQATDGDPATTAGRSP